MASTVGAAPSALASTVSLDGSAASWLADGRILVPVRASSRSGDKPSASGMRMSMPIAAGRGALMSR